MEALNPGNIRPQLASIKETPVAPSKQRAHRDGRRRGGRRDAIGSFHRFNGIYAGRPVRFLLGYFFFSIWPTGGSLWATWMPMPAALDRFMFCRFRLIRFDWILAAEGGGGRGGGGRG